jgi:hypothetical protein
VKKQNIKNSKPKVNQLSSLTNEEMEKLLKVFKEKVRQRIKMYTLQGKRRKRIQLKESKNSSLLGSKKKLEFILLYLKGNMNQIILGHFFEMSQSKVSQWFSYLLPVLESSLRKLGYMPVYQECYYHKNQKDAYVFGDVTERELPRKTCYKAQKEDYSGKQHQHTEKNFALCNEQGYIHFLSASYTGSTHDKTIFDELNINSGKVPFLMDLGFIGAEEDSNEILLPFKKKKGKKLNKVQQQINQAMSSVRVRVEHAFAGLKRLNIIGQKIRIRSYEKRQSIVRIAAAIHNFRVAARTPIRFYS